MKKYLSIVLSSTLFVIPQAFAAEVTINSEGRACETISKACVAAGFSREEDATKQFWRDCMKPILLGNTVEGVTADHMVTDNCRTDKIAELKKELEELQNVTPKKM